MFWRDVGERFISCGELLLSLDLLERYDLDLSILNCGKVGSLYKVTYMYVMFLAVVRYLFSMPYRQLERFTQAYTKTTHGLVLPVFHRNLRLLQTTCIP
jgi:hypothetical protein